MSDSLFEARRRNLESEGEPCALNVAAVAEALDTIQSLREQNVGTETVAARLGEFKSWDPDILRVDKDTENGFRRRLELWGRPVVLLSEEAGRLEIHPHANGPEYYAVADPFDGSYLFKRGIADFWYTSLAFFDTRFRPVSCAVGDGVARTIAYANDLGAYLVRLDGDRLSDRFRLDAEYRERLGRRPAGAPEQASVESYAMKPRKFLAPLIDQYRDFVMAFQFFLPNGGPNGFVDVAEGKIDVYFAPQQPFVDVFSGIYVALQAGAVVTDFEGNPVHCQDNVHTVLDVVASTGAKLHEKVLDRIAACRKERP